MSGWRTETGGFSNSTDAVDRTHVEEIGALEVVERPLVEVALAALLMDLGLGEDQQLGDVDAADMLEIAGATQSFEQVGREQAVLVGRGIPAAAGIEGEAARAGQDEPPRLMADAA